MDTKKVTRSTHTANKFTGQEQEGRDLLVASGVKVKESGHDWIGSVSVHIYKGSALDINPSVYFKIQTCLSEYVDEGIASHAYQELQKTLKEMYGRTH